MMTCIPVYFCLQICICSLPLSILMFWPAGPAASENQIQTEMKDQTISSNFSVPGCHVSKPAAFFYVICIAKIG